MPRCRKIYFTACTGLCVIPPADFDVLLSAGFQQIMSTWCFGFRNLERWMRCRNGLSRVLIRTSLRYVDQLGMFMEDEAEDIGFQMAIPMVWED